VPDYHGMPRRALIDFIALDMLARKQNYVATYQQLNDLGLPRATVSHRTRNGGPWLRLLPGVYLLSNGPPTQEQRERAALLYAGEGSVLTGTCALLRHGLLKISHIDFVHVLIPHQRRRASASYLVIERTTRLPQSISKTDLPCAEIGRAVADTCRKLRNLTDVRAVVAEAVQRRRCTIPALEVELHNGPIRASALFRRALDEVREGTRSVAESEARDLIRAARLPEPTWNCDLCTLDGEWLACPDGWWDDVGVALEIDSREWHLSPEGWKRTMRRHMRMSALGIIVLHVPPSRIRHDRSALVSEIAAALRHATGRPHPPVRVKGPFNQ